VIALYAVGVTPLVLLGAGLLFLLVALSYAEATSALPETGGAATFVRRSVNDLAGFMTGWALFLDYLIVISLSALFMPHYLGAAVQADGLERHPWDVIVAVCSIAGIAGVRLFRRPSLYAVGFVVPALDLLVQLLLVIVGFAVLFSPDALTRGTSLGASPTWHDLLFAIPLAMLAYTGLETVANLAEEARRPGIDLPRSLFAAIGAVVTLYVAIAVVALSAFPGPDSALGHRWLRAPLVGVAEQVRRQEPPWLGDTIRFFVGVSGALILLTAITTSMSGYSRLAYSLGEHGQLPRAFGRLHRRTLVSPEAIVSAALVTIAIVVATSYLGNDVTFLASVFSFGVLIAFTATQAAVLRLRMTEPDLARPYRAPLDIRFRGALLPLPAIAGAILTFAVWIIAMITHPGARYGGPAWLAAGLVVYVAVRRAHGEGLTERVIAPDEQVFDDVPHFRRILVPL
jgi:APA family basic amino acid/polyamine antiporter